MKKYLPLILGLVLLAGAPIVLVNGCGTTPNRVTYQTLSTTRVTVETAMGLWNVWVGAQHAKGVDTTAQETTVRNLFNKWKDAQMAICNAGMVYSAAVTTNSTGATGLSAALQTALADATQAKADLFNALTQFGVTLPTS